MNFEFEQIREIFIAECSELLQKMEASLLAIESNPAEASDEQIGEIFRSIHTIKGNAGVFGFARIVDFTHGIETLLDQARDGKIAMSFELVELLLEARDQLSELVECAANDNPVSDESLLLQKQITEKLSLFYHPKVFVVSDKVIEKTAIEIQKSPVDSKGILPQKNGLWHISLRYKEDTFKNGLDPISIFNYLNKIGEIRSLYTITDSFPKESESFDAENCYLGFELLYNTNGDKQLIEEAFEFVQYDCDIVILPPQRSVDELLEFFEKRNGHVLKLVKILLYLGSIERSDVSILRKQKNSQKNIIESKKITSINLKLEESKDESNKKIEIKKPTEKESVSEHPIKDKKSKTDSKTIRIDSVKLDQLINLVGELVISGANMNQLSFVKKDSEFAESSSNLNRLISEIRDTSLNLRMVQVGDTFARFFRVVRDISTELSKDVQLYTSGGETELDKILVEKLSDPLMHLIRNALDHGIETVEERLALGKSKKASIYLNAFHEAGNVVIEVRDDGRGIAKNKVLQKALEKGLIPEDKKNLSNQEIFSLIFLPGFSTADVVTNISGRGVGLDVVDSNIKQLRGSIRIDSEEGKGTSLQIRLPLTLAIIDGFVFRVANSYFAIPSEQVVECLEFSRNLESENSKNFFNLRGELLPYLRLADFFNLESRKSNRKNLLVLQYLGKNVGLLVDELEGQQQAVIKPLGKIFQKLRGISGSTILGNGEVALILDLPLLFQKVVFIEKQEYGIVH
jgi:two-component system chemotaxis sensor kinase CheA